METIHSAIAWYQKKIGSYDKQLWEQSVEKKLQKGLPNVHHAPRKTVRLKTEYIDVDLIRGSTFTKTKPQVPWIYITRKAFVRVLFFPFYYRWWVLQSSRKVYYLLLTLYLLQVITAFIYFWNLDGSVIEDELTLTEVVVPIGLMFLLGLIHSQTVLAHFSLKPPRPIGRHSSKQKKRQRQGTSLPTRNLHDITDHAATHHTGSVDSVRDSQPFREMSPSRPHRRTTSLWNVPRVEISVPETTANSTPQQSCPPPSSSQPCCSSVRQPSPSPSALRQTCSQTRAGTRNTKRMEKKNARVVIIDGDATCCHDNGQPQKLPQSSSLSSLMTVKATNLEDSFDDLELHCENPNSVGFEKVNGVSASVDTVGTGLNADSRSGVVLGGRDVVASGKVKAADTDKSSSGLDDLFDDGTSFPEGSTGQVLTNTDTATTDSDSLAGRFVMIRMDSVATATLGKPDASASVPANSSRSYHHHHHHHHHHHQPHRSHPSRSSFSEDGGGTDHREEENMSENLSDTGGHVSNSSNYNPSDSGSEGNYDDGDTVGMPVPLTNPPSSSSSTATTTMDGEVIAGGAGGGGSSGSANHLLSNSTSSPSRPSALPSSPRKQSHPVAQREGEESSASDPGSPDPRQNASALRRRRRTSANQTGVGSGGGSTEQAGDRGGENVTGSGSGIRPRPLLPKLVGLRAQSKVTQTSGISSSDNEASHLTPEGVNKATISSEEWEDRMQSDVTTSSSYSTSNSDSELSENANIEDENEDDPLAHECLPHGAFHGINLLQPPSSSNPALHGAQPDKVSCMIWEVNECKKLDLTALDIGWAIIDKVDNLPESSDYIFIGVFLSLCLGCVPFVFRLFTMKGLPGETTYQVWLWLWAIYQRNSWGQNLIMVNGVLQRLALSCIFFFLLTVTDRTFKQRLLYAKHFSYLTSSRRARKFDMPHFRLNKVRNIKIWLSLRSYLKRRGPQRSVDVIVSASFYLTISLICLMCIQMLKDSDTYLDYLCNWELIVWCLALGIYIMRFMTLGLKINKKYRNLSVLITEQINLYLQMEQKPHKKEELTLANNVLRLAEDLLKELESPFKISGFSANPLIYNITKVVVLSAFSAVLTEVLGFKLKLYKIKLK